MFNIFEQTKSTDKGIFLSILKNMIGFFKLK